MYSMSDRAARILTVVMPIVVLALSLYRLNESYSYWFDEIYSVTTAIQSFSNMFVIAFDDVHPPLYQIILWIWVRIFGDSEVATRILSCIFIISASLFFFRIIMILPRRAGSIAFVLFFSSWLVPYYAQETRVYALLLFLSTVSLYYFLSLEQNKSANAVILSSVFVGLTHFFGILLSILILLWLTVERYKHFKVLFCIVSAFIGIMAWPFVQLVFGSAVGDAIGGNFWIVSSGPLHTLHKAANIFAMAKFLPQHSSWGNLIVGACAFLLIASYFYCIKHHELLFCSIRDLEMFRRLSFLFGGILFVVVLLDLHTPVSTTRNFIILLPISAVLFGILISGIAKGNFFKSVSFVCVLVFGMLSLNASYHKLEEKWTPLENWRSASAIVVNKIRNSDIQWRVFYFQPREESSMIYGLINRYYIQKMRPGLTLEFLFESDIGKISDPFILLAGHLFGRERDEVLEKVRLFHKGCEFHSPEQRWADAVVVVVCHG